jgi:hypothetical protein
MEPLEPIEPLELNDKPVSWVDTWPLIPLLQKFGAKYLNLSYFALYRPLQDLQSRLILCCAVILSVAAGAPLPIIGVIFARIIDSFPPSEHEVRERVVQLIGVGELKSHLTSLYSC